MWIGNATRLALTRRSDVECDVFPTCIHTQTVTRSLQTFTCIRSGDDKYREIRLISVNARNASCVPDVPGAFCGHPAWTGTGTGMPHVCGMNPTSVTAVRVSAHPHHHDTCRARQQHRHGDDKQRAPHCRARPYKGHTI